MIGLGFTLNGIHSDAYGILCKSQRELMPGREAKELAVPGRHGTFEYGDPVFGKRTFVLTCTIQASTLPAMRSAARGIAAWLASATELIFDDDPGKRWTGRVYDAVGLDIVSVTGQFEFTFSAQPFAEDTVEQTATINGTAVDYGTQMHFYPVITVTYSAPGTSLLVLHQESGQHIQLAGTFAAADVVVIDMARGKVTRNGSAIMPAVALDSLFFGVPTGSQTITMTTDGAATATMAYRRRYL